MFKHLNESVTSTDKDLHALIDRLKNEVTATSDLHTIDQVIGYVAKSSVVLFHASNV